MFKAVFYLCTGRFPPLTPAFIFPTPRICLPVCVHGRVSVSCVPQIVRQLKGSGKDGAACREGLAALQTKLSDKEGGPLLNPHPSIKLPTDDGRKTQHTTRWNEDAGR